MAHRIAWVLAGCISIAVCQEPENPYLIRSKFTEKLPFYIRHQPKLPESLTASPSELNWQKLPEGISAHLADVGELNGHHVFSIRYLSDERLKNGSDGAVAILILASTVADQQKFKPVYYAEDDPGVIQDYSTSSVIQVGELSFFWVRIHLSGNAQFTQRQALTADVSSDAFRIIEVFADVDYMKALRAQGWDMWTKGHWFDEATLRQYHHIYREPSKAPNKEENLHAHITVQFVWKDGKLVPGEPVFAGEDE